MSTEALIVETGPDRPVVVVAADSHVGPSMADLRPYCERKHLDDFDAFVEVIEGGDSELYFDPLAANLGYTRFGMSEQDIKEAFAEAEALPNRNALSIGSYEIDVRNREMDYDGVTADVIFHGTRNPAGVMKPLPFSVTPAGSGPGFEDGWSAKERELAAAGRQIYNRWLSDFCAAAPERHVGIAHIPIWDLDESVKVLEWAAENGFRGINFPSPQEALPPYEDADAWNRFFSASCDLNLPLVTHTGGGRRLGPFYEGPAQMAILLQEMPFMGTRNVWHLIFSGAFDRHPDLNLVITEVPGTWFEGTIRDMDSIYDERGHAGPTLRRFMRKRPSEYMSSNVYFGVSFMSRGEARSVVELGLTDRVMWGSDYPHAEGTYMYFDDGDPEKLSLTRLALQDTFTGLPEAEVRKMAGANAIRCYSLDPAPLTSIAERIGPRLEELTGTPDLARVPAEYTGLAFRRVGPYT